MPYFAARQAAYMFARAPRSELTALSGWSLSTYLPALASAFSPRLMRTRTAEGSTGAGSPPAACAFWCPDAVSALAPAGMAAARPAASAAASAALWSCVRMATSLCLGGVLSPETRCADRATRAGRRTLGTGRFPGIGRPSGARRAAAYGGRDETPDRLPGRRLRRLDRVLPRGGTAASARPGPGDPERRVGRPQPGSAPALLDRVPVRRSQRR